MNDSKKKRSLRGHIWRRISYSFQLRDPRRDLSSILENADPGESLQDRILWVAQLVEWLRGRAIKNQEADQTASNRIVRLRFLFQLLDRHPAWKLNVGTILSSILRDSEAPSLFAQTTLTEQSGFVAEFFRRFVDKFIPPAPAPGQLGYAVEVVFTNNDDLLWLEAMTDDDWIRLSEVLSASPVTSIANSAGLALMRDLRESVVKLSVQTAALGFAADVRARLHDAHLDKQATSPFLRLNRAAIHYQEGAQGSATELRGLIRTCEDEVGAVYKRIATSGISISLVYRLEAMTGLLRRLDLLLGFATSDPNEIAHWSTARPLVLEIVRTHLHRHSISSLFGLNFDLFARKLIEHAGESGEHYITSTAREYWAMFRSAAGGGLLTVITTLAKFAIANLHFPMFFEGLAYGLNYSISFLAMQAFGFVLATKQSSMTAAALAGHLSDKPDRSRIGEFVTIIAQITRSQFIAILGNVGLVIPGAFLVDWLFHLSTGQHIISAKYAMHTLESFHPWHTLTILYAAETGVILWLSSLGAGWLQNWVIYRKIPEALATHQTLHALLGEKRSRELGETIRHSASGWGGNISIGLMLGFFPLIGQIFGLPLDIRHITLSSGQITFALCSLDPSTITTSLVLESLLGLTMIGVMNFTVSTACALFVAVRARGVHRIWFRTILRDVRRAFFKNPVPFFLPPLKAPQTALAEKD